MKLSTAQYQNTIRDLVGALGAGELTSELEPLLAAIPDDSRSGGFSGLDGRVSLEHVQGYYQVAEHIASALAADEATLREVAGACILEQPPEDDCLRNFAERVGLLAFRHAPTTEEVDQLVATAQTASNGGEQVRALLLSALLSPRFVNQVEVDGAWSGSTDQALLQLSSYEIASRLSYTFWQTMPDTHLFEVAAAGELQTAQGMKDALDYVLSDPRARETSWQFWKEWLGLDRFTGFEFGRPGFQSLTAGLGIDTNLYADMVDEVRLLTERFTFDQAGTYRQLVTTNVSVTPSAQLARLYGVQPWDGSGSLPTLDATERAGLLQRAALLVSSLEQTNPFHRGAFFKRYLLCENLPAPDPAALPPGSLDIPPTSAAETTRERFQKKIADNPLCTGCHGLFSSVGYTLEAYDSLGRFRTTEQVFDEANGELVAELAVDSSADVTIGGQVVSVASPSELVSIVVDSGQLEGCLAQQYLRFVQRREISQGTTDECIQRDVAAQNGSTSLLSGFRRVAELTSFHQRKVGPQ